MRTVARGQAAMNKAFFDGEQVWNQIGCDTPAPAGDVLGGSCVQAADENSAGFDGRLVLGAGQAPPDR